MPELDISGNRLGNFMQATGQASALPFTIREFINPRTKSQSWRVDGYGHKGRVRKNFGPEKGGEAAARAFCDKLNADEIRTKQQLPPMRAMPTRLSEQDITAVEAMRDRAKGRWSVSEMITAGYEVLSNRPKPVSVAALFEEWKKTEALSLNERWRNQISHNVAHFLNAHPDLTSHSWTSAITRVWLDGQSINGNTKANKRSALHLFARWYCERAGVKDNPASGIRIARKADKGKESAAPAVLTPLQVHALLHVYSLEQSLRRGLGWFVECTFAGLRPENEAPHALWAEIDLQRGEQKVLGYKRGIKPRVAMLHPTAVAWLREFKKDWPAIVKAEEKPQLAPYNNDQRRTAVATANMWLAQHHPAEPQITWVNDILRHTYASMRAASGVRIDELAEEMGTSVKVIYAHYRHAMPPRVAKEFWALTPDRIAR